MISKDKYLWVAKIVEQAIYKQIGYKSSLPKKNAKRKPLLKNIKIKNKP